VIEQEELTGVVLAERDELERRIGHDRMIRDLLPLMPETPDPACLVVAVHVAPDQRGQPHPAIDIATRDRRGLGMGMIDNRGQDRTRSTLPLGMNRLPAFHDAPAIIPTTLNTMDQLPELPAHIARPQVTVGSVEAHFPGVAQTKRPDLGPRSLDMDEGIVGGNGVGSRRVGMVNIDPQNRGEEIAQVLAGALRVWRGGAGAVSRGDIEIPIGSKGQAAAVVPSSEPSEQNRLALGLDPGRIARPYLEGREPGSIGTPISEDVAKIDETIGCIVRVQRQAVEG
jgi:hypothetical protein